MNYPVAIDPKAYEMLRSLLSKGIVEQEGKTLDFSPVQQITIRNGVMTLNPPAKVIAEYGPIKLRTTISSLTVQANGIHVEVDNSPVDLELRPQ